jgi:hypothetical protein
MNKPLVDKKYLLEKSPGKGGWTYTVIPEILADKKSPLFTLFYIPIMTRWK